MFPLKASDDDWGLGALAQERKGANIGVWFTLFSLLNARSLFIEHIYLSLARFPQFVARYGLCDAFANRQNTKVNIQPLYSILIVFVGLWSLTTWQKTRESRFRRDSSCSTISTLRNEHTKPRALCQNRVHRRHNGGNCSEGAETGQRFKCQSH